MLLKRILDSAKSNLENAIQDVVNNAFRKKKLEECFLNCAEFIIAREKPSTSLSDSEKETQFSDKITALFSEENMREIYLDLRGTPGYNYIKMLQAKLGRLCGMYDVDDADAEYFVNGFIKVFRECIYEHNKTLAHAC